ncbi:MAG: DUF11 domain-containing protein [Planctomycetes bacterium]|nr:DUF11 domain-containing protein [Planctomycetota bacterium]
MLSADMAEILGVVRTDIGGDGIASNDTVVAGATAALYRDGGNNVFDGGSGDDVLVSSVTTNSLGQYQFDQIGAGRYFVKVTLPADLQFHLGEDVKEVVIAADEGNGVVGPAIDGFTTTQVVEATPPLPASAVASLLDPAVLGGERDLFVELTNSTNPISSVALASSGGKLYFASGSDVTGVAKVVWDGVDGNGQLVNPTGLGGIDLTQADGNTMTGIALTSGADHPNAKITMRIYTDANNWSEFTTTVPESVGGTASGQAVFHFDDVPTAKSGSGADFTNVGALELTFEGVSAVDAQVTLVGLVGRATKQLDFTASPRLSVGDRVWADRDDDGILDPGEVGIAGVKLNLYEDTNGDNQFTQGVDALFGTTTTDATGNYLFADLFPGKYIVQVDPTNFQVQQPLHRLTSSSGNDPAPDPDDNVNNDDNGSTLAGAGVVSRAVTLAGDSEPTNDGDSSNDSNLTVDFGFFGFDLVLDKSVEQTVLSPQETVEYRIRINNDGPSDAANTTFIDTLPSHVTFVSGTTSLSGVGVQHAGGIVTANLGTMKTGDVVIVTLLATVNDDAIGTLVNTATVSAPKEVNLSNNTDTVSNPVQPKIDLAITKTDSRDPVEPGSTFSYTLNIVNNGPSDATGVVVTDDLPDVGVSFQSASLVPDSFDGDQLTFHLGDLAKGESTSITINVRVDDDFSGQLLNHTEVFGNEPEITLANNQDTEPTLVKIDPASLGGTVFVDRNDNGVFDSGEATLLGVIITLKGVDVMGAAVVRTTSTAADGSYLFDNLNPGTYRVVETQPARYKDGKDHVGTLGGATGENPGLFLIPNDMDTEQIKDLLLGITLGSGDVGLQYDFGELSHNTSKADFVRPLFYR